MINNRFHAIHVLGWELLTSYSVLLLPGPLNFQPCGQDAYADSLIGHTYFCMAGSRFLLFINWVYHTCHSLIQW